MAFNLSRGLGKIKLDPGELSWGQLGCAPSSPFHWAGIERPEPVCVPPALYLEVAPNALEPSFFAEARFWSCFDSPSCSPFHELYLRNRS